MKFKQITTICILIALVFISCSLNVSSGAQFDLLKDTPVWSLAKAVEDEDTAEIRELIQEKHLDVNYKESRSQWGVTLLHLAVYNEKLLSIKALLENGAKQDIRDSLGDYPINDIVDMTTSYKHRKEILELLLEHGADPNSEVKGYRDKDTTPYQVGIPLMRAVSDLECTKLLLKYGANVYANFQPRNFNDSCSKYHVWNEVFNFHDNSSESIFVAKYLIVDKHFAVPQPICFGANTTVYDIRPFTALELLNKATFIDPAKQKAKEDILAYLQKEGFPEHGAIPNPPPKR